MGHAETSREPCPDRILDDVGTAFGMGAVGGSAFHFIKGLYNSPGGHRVAGASQSVRMNAPRLGGSFAVWGGLFSAFDCTLVYARQKEDPWNSVLAGAATGGLLQVRQGLRASSRSALAGGVLLGLIEGLGIVVTKFDALQRNNSMPVVFEDEIPSKSSETMSSSPSWFGGWVGGKKEEARGFRTEVLESFDSPVPPTFEFK